jgi:hypothetical protein
VGLRAGLSAVYLGNGWVATANHVAAGDVVLGGVTYPYVPDSKIRIGNGAGMFGDLAVFRVDPAPAWPLLPISSRADLRGEQVIMIGQGRDRGAALAACVPQREGFLWAGQKTKRWGENVVVDYTTALSTHAFFATFDAAGLSHEAQAADGDSGGAVFVKNGGEWQLAGLMFVTSAFACQPASSSFYGNLTYVADLAAYRDEITAIVRPQCSDEFDNDGDLALDYPDDADCTSALHDDEQSAPASLAAVPSLSPVGLAGLLGLVFAGGVAASRRRLE